MKPQIVPVRQLRERKDSLEDLVTWLRAHGASKRSARRFLIKTGCDSLHSVAVWLRFQLPPLHLANEDCIVSEMKTQLEVGRKDALAIIEELNVKDCVNVDINQEATAFLVHTGQLSQQYSPMGAGLPAATAGISRQSTQQDPSSHFESFTLSPNARMPIAAPHSFGSHPVGPGGSSHILESISPTAISPPTSGGGGAPPRGSTGRSQGLGPQVPPHKYAVYNNLFQVPKNNTEAAKPWIVVTQTSENSMREPGSPSHQPSPSDFLAGDGDSMMHEPGVMFTEPSRARGAQPLGEDAEAPIYAQGEGPESRKLGAGRDARALGEGQERSKFGAGRESCALGEGKEWRALWPLGEVGEIDEVGGREGGHRHSDGRYGQAAGLGEGSGWTMLGEGSGWRSLGDSLPGRALGEGQELQRPAAPLKPINTLGVHPVAEGRDTYKHLERKLDHKLGPLKEEATLDPCMNTAMTTLTSVDLHRMAAGGASSFLHRGTSEPLPSDKLPGVPTVSGPLDPGAYHKANTMLRRQLPHYKSKVTVTVHWDHLFFWYLTIASVCMYISTRLYYLVSGKSSTLSGGDVNIPFSWMTLVADFGLAVLGVYLHQNFWKQEVHYTNLDDLGIQQLNREVKQKGMKETVHVLITTYTEPAVTVKECVLRLLVAPEPIYMEKMIYVCDDGHAKSEGPKKKAMVEELRILGHNNVFYVGDRVKKPDQLNGKSANLNHVLLKKIYPNVKKAEEVPIKDIFMVMDCDHMVKPDLFNKMGPTMLDSKMAVCLVPQCFHNTIHPDALDAANGDFMFGKLPFYFGAGVLFVTGTNVMVRCRPAFEVCKFAEANAEATEDGEDHRQLFTVDEISEDVVLGSRLHAAGFKGVFVAENLATGEVPLEARAMWRQRFRWFKGGHLFLLSPTSVFFEKSSHMTFYQKTLYWICLVANIMSIYADPILFMLPFMCLTFNICAYGMDDILFWTHFVHAIILQFTGCYYSEWARVKDALKAHVAFRVLWFTTVKACINTVMVMTGWKKSGVFKATPKLGEKAEEASTRLPDVVKSEAGSKDGSSKGMKEGGGKGFELHQVHDALSKVTETRKRCLPFDGTLDFWVIMFVTGSTLYAVISGTITLLKADAFRNFDIQNASLKWLAIVWGLHQAMPGMVFAGYLMFYRTCPQVLKVWVPAVVFIVFSGILVIEARVAYGFGAEFDCSKIAC